MYPAISDQKHTVPNSAEECIKSHQSFVPREAGIMSVNRFWVQQIINKFQPVYTWKQRGTGVEGLRFGEWFEVTSATELSSQSELLDLGVLGAWKPDQGKALCPDLNFGTSQASGCEMHVASMDDI